MAAWVLVAEVKPEKGIEVATIPDPEIVPVQAKLPLELVTVQPVDPDPPPMRISPVPVLFKFKASAPLASIERAISVSDPVAAMVTTPLAAALAMVNSSTAEAVEVNLKNSLPLVSRILAPFICKSSAIIVLVPVLSIVKLPDASTV